MFGINLSLRMQVILTMNIALCIVAGAAQSVNVYSNYQERQAEMAVHLDLTLTTTAEAVSRPMYDFNTPVAEAVVAAMKGDPDLKGAVVAGTKGEVVAKIGALPADAEAHAFLIGQRDIVYVNGADKTSVGKLTVALSKETLSAYLIHEMKAGLVMMMMLMSATAVTIWLSFARVSRPLTAITESMNRLAAGDIDAALPAADRHDEIGDMLRALRVFKDNAGTMRSLHAEREAQERALTDKLKAEVKRLTDALDHEVQNVVRQIAQRTDQMRGLTTAMSDSVHRVDGQSREAALAADQASDAVRSVAAASDELSASIREISQQVCHSTRIAGTAVDEARRADAMIQGLSQAAQKIGEVVSLITDVASQTNLLALNATIEAARAGDAGKGFAVVASEVKTLANQTARATEEISAQITSIQGATRDAVAAIKGIGDTISEMNQIATVIASAVEEQSAATAGISQAASHAATGTHRASDSIALVTREASDTGAKANEVSARVDEVAGTMAELQTRLTGIIRQS